jgi:hypothetical protein
MQACQSRTSCCCRDGIFRRPADGRALRRMSKINRLMPTVAETERIPNRRNSRLKSRSRISDGPGRRFFIVCGKFFMSDQRVITAQNNRVGMVSADAISVSITKAAHRFMLQFREAVNFWRIRPDFEGRFWRSAHVRLPSPWLMRARLGYALMRNNVFAIVGLEL